MIFGSYPRMNRLYGWELTAPTKHVSRSSTTRVMGVDLGQAHDFSAAAVLDMRSVDSGFTGPRDERIHVSALRRWPNGTDYGDVIEDILSCDGLTVVVVEYNGVGRPVVDWMRRRSREREFQGRIIPVLTAASRARMHLVEEPNGQSVTVPKVDIVSSINMLVMQRRLAIPESEELPNLVKELREFQMRVTKNANLQFGNESGAGKHDDMVIALGLACWFVTRFGASKREPAIYVP